MTLDEYNRFARSLHATTHVVQWGGAMSGKSAARFSPSAAGMTGEGLFVTFKCSERGFDLLKEQPGLIPAPYLASRGMTWIQRRTCESMDDAALKDYLARKLPADRSQTAEAGEA